MLHTCSNLPAQSSSYSSLNARDLPKNFLKPLNLCSLYYHTKSQKSTKTRYAQPKLLPTSTHQSQLTKAPPLRKAPHQLPHFTMVSFKTLMFSLLISAAAATPTLAGPPIADNNNDDAATALDKRLECGGGQFHTGPTPSGGNGCAWYWASGALNVDCCEASCVCSYWGPVCKTSEGRC